MTSLPRRSESQRELSILLGERYRLLRQIGEGGTSQVYEAEHQLTGERVALKVIPLKRVGDKKTVTRFLREAKLTQGLSHPGFVQILDAWIDSDQRCCLVMERLYGSSLRELTSSQNLIRGEAIDIIISVLEPLEIAHREGIVHRDLKPENIFIHSPKAEGQERVVKLLDFGLSRSVLSPTVTHTGQFVGTPWYISPEQAFSPKQCEPSSDIWSVGVILYELLCDRVPFDGESLPVICMSIKQDPHRPILEWNPNVDPTLVSLVNQCLSKDPALRPQDAGELKRALQSLKRYFVHQTEAEVISAGAIRGTPATLDVNSASMGFGETIGHDTDDDVHANAELNELISFNEASERGLTVPLSSSEIAERLKELDEELSREQEALELELGPTAIGTLKAIDWPDPEEPSTARDLEPHVLDTESMTARDDLLRLIKDDPIESDYLESDAVTVRPHDHEEIMNTLRGPPQRVWSADDLKGKGDALEIDFAEASDVTSEVVSGVTPLPDEGEALSAPPSNLPPPRMTEALSSKHAPPPTLLGAPQVEDTLDIHNEETSVSQRKRVELIDPNATTHRKVSSPFIKQTVSYQESEVTPIISSDDQAQLSRSEASWSRPIQISSLEFASTSKLSEDSSGGGDEHNPSLLLWASLLIFITALMFALWSAI